jgi:SAM-dependent methyltransferase
MTPLGTSHRRRLLDADLARVTAGLAGSVLDVGGRRRGRGGFHPPDGVRWIRLNVDAAAAPDIVADAHALPIRSGALDAAVCLETLEYVEAPERAVVELARVLRAGGRALVSTPFLHRADAATDRRRFTAAGLREVLERAGLVVVEVAPQGRFFTVLANMLRQATAALPARLARWGVGALTIPLGGLLVRLDGLDAVRRSPFLASFSTGYLAVARKP